MHQHDGQAGFGVAAAEFHHMQVAAIYGNEPARGRMFRRNPPRTDRRHHGAGRNHAGSNQRKQHQKRQISRPSTFSFRFFTFSSMPLRRG